MNQENIEHIRNPYRINCATKAPPREFEAALDQSKRVAASLFQEAPTLREINERDASRLNLVRALPTVTKVHDALMLAKIEGTTDQLLKSAYQTALQGERLTGEQGLQLLNAGDLNLLGWLATKAKERFHPQGKVSYLLDRNINYTNICRVGCDFCAFYRRGHEQDAYVLPKEEIWRKIEETIEVGGTGTLMQGGVNPHLKIEYYEDLFRSIKERYKIHLHALSVIEIEGIAQVSRLSVEETLERLKAAGLDSIPGAGAEILADEIRLEQSPVKRHSHRWISVMQAAHRANLPTTATMMFGALEERKHIIEHILRIRDAQDETQGFYAFILWTFQGEHTDLLKKNPELQQTSGAEYLRVLAVSRLMMDNIPNIQGSWVTMGPKIGQISLHYGANDMGSIMIEENVVSAAGTSFSLDRKSMVELIRRAGFSPVQRDTYYNILHEHEETT